MEKKKVTEHEKYHLIFSTDWSQIFLILRRIEGDMLSNVQGSSYKVPVTLVIFLCNLEVLDKLSKSMQISSFMKIRSVEA